MRHLKAVLNDQHEVQPLEERILTYQFLSHIISRKDPSQN